MTTPGTIILGNEYQALGLLRLLSMSGIQCILVDQDPWGPALFSRFRCPFYHSPHYASEQFWPWLVNLAQQHDYLGWVVIPTDDEQVRQLAEHFSEAVTLFRFVGLPWSDYRYIYDKRLAFQWIKQLDLPAPQTYIPLRRDDLPYDGLPLPAIVKPAVKRTFSRYSNKKAIPFESINHLKRLLEEDLKSVPIEELLYQEIIPGDGKNQWSYAGFFVEGEPKAAFTACRRRQHPPDFGRASTYVIAIHDEEVERLSCELLLSLKYTGLAEIEWKRDPRDGQLKFLEMNARCWGWHSLSSRVVGNIPKMFYDYLLYSKAETVQPHYGSRWVKWITDIPVAFDLMKRGELGFKEYIRSVLSNTISCEWEITDPFPFFLQFALLPYLIMKRGY